MMYNPADWYWTVGDDATQVYSSARAASVPASDSQYLAFLARGGGATPIASLAALAEVLAAQYPAGMLTTYANAKQWGLAIGGYTITLSGVVCTFQTDSESQTLITGKAVRLAQPNPPATIEWQFASGAVTLTAADFLLAAVAIADFVQATFDTLLKTVLPALAAGTMTTRDQIDAAAWPSNVHS